MILVSRTIRIDWPRLIGNLRKCGMSTGDIAAAVEVSPSSIKGYADEAMNSEPAYWTGAALLVLWADRTGCRWTDAPTRTVQPSASEMLREMA